MWIDEFNIQEDVKIYSRLPDYDDLQGFDLSNETDVASISRRIFTGFAKPWLTIKRQLFNAHFPTKLFKAIMIKKQDESCCTFETHFTCNLGVKP